MEVILVAITLVQIYFFLASENDFPPFCFPLKVFPVGVACVVNSSFIENFLLSRCFVCCINLFTIFPDAFKLHSQWNLPTHNDRIRDRVVPGLCSSVFLGLTYEISNNPTFFHFEWTFFQIWISRYLSWNFQHLILELVICQKACVTSRGVVSRVIARGWRTPPENAVYLQPVLPSRHLRPTMAGNPWLVEA